MICVSPRVCAPHFSPDLVHVWLLSEVLTRRVNFLGRAPAAPLQFAHAHARFISTTTKPLPDLATNTDYVTLTLTAFTTTPICKIAPADAADLGGAWLLFLCLALIRGQGDRLT
jgi:hypothetical protein